MSRFTKRAAISAAVVALAATLATLGAAPVANGQEGAPPTVSLAPTPAPSGVTSTRAVIPTGAEGYAATTGGNESAVPAGSTESVIGGDGRTRVPVSATSSFPLSAIGQVEFFQDNGTQPGNYTCTGWLIDKNSILTSGHCSFDPPASTGNGDGGGLIASATFFPGRNNTGNGVVQNPFGSCSAQTVFAPTQWMSNGKPQFDYSVQNLTPSCDFSATAGSFGMFSLPGTNAFAGRRMRVEGYPGDLGRLPGNYGSRYMMAGNVHHSSNTMLFYPMDTYGGQSGSPVFKFNRPSCGGPCGGAVHSYGAGGTPLNNSGPRLTDARISEIVSFASQNGV